MSVAPLGIVVLAAGEARRFGAPKLVAPIDGVPMIRRVAVAACASAAHVVLVTGAHRESVEAAIADLALTCVFNPRWSDGMGGSIARGVAALIELDHTLAAVIIVLGDQPRVTSADLLQLPAVRAASSARIVAAQYAGVLGPPCLFAREYFAELGALRGGRGARAVLQRHLSDVCAVPMPNAAFDVDTPEDYARMSPQV